MAAKYFTTNKKKMAYQAVWPELEVDKENIALEGANTQIVGI